MSKNEAFIIVRRDRSSSGSLRLLEIYIDDKLVDTIKSGKEMKASVTPGVHYIQVKLSPLFSKWIKHSPVTKVELSEAQEIVLECSVHEDEKSFGGFIVLCALSILLLRICSINYSLWLKMEERLWLMCFICGVYLAYIMYNLPKLKSAFAYIKRILLKDKTVPPLVLKIVDMQF